MRKFHCIILASVSLLVNATAFGQQGEKVTTGTTAEKPSAADQNEIPDTVMFTIDEINDIRSHLVQPSTEEGVKQDDRAIENATLYLSTILYSGPDDWRVWVNGVPIGPNDALQSFKVIGISPSSVELLVPLSAQGMRPVHLGLNQTFIAKSGIVVEGQVK